MRKLINNALIRLLDGKSGVALALSGGTDSTCLLYSLLELGFEPVLYTYHLDGIESDDLVRAKTLAKLHGLRLVICPIRHDLDALIEDVSYLLKLGIKGKVAIQCCHGHKYIADVLQESAIVNGSGVDGLLGSYRDVRFIAEIVKQDNKTAFDAYREKHLANPNDDAMEYQNLLYGGRAVFPYRDQPVVNYLMGLSWWEINKPKLKSALTRHYPELQKLPRGFYRPRGSQQIVAGVREFHDLLLFTRFNTGGWKSVTGVYRWMEKLI